MTRPKMLKDSAEALPVTVSDDERLARAIFHPFHVDKTGRLKKEAFKAPTGRRDVSVNRLRALSADECKARSVQIRNPGDFQGFAVILTGEVRHCGADVVDTRECYLGHADILHSIVLESGVPAPPEFNQRLKSLALAARYIADPDPKAEGWNGPELDL